MGFDESNIKKFGYNKKDWNKVAKAYNETLDGGDEGVCGEDHGQAFWHDLRLLSSFTESKSKLSVPDSKPKRVDC